MKRRLLLFAKYHINSPRQLKTRPRPSVRLNLALGLVIFSSTPVSSVAGPLFGWMQLLVFNRCVNTRCSRSSNVWADMYISFYAQLRIQVVNNLFIPRVDQYFLE